MLRSFFCVYLVGALGYRSWGHRVLVVYSSRLSLGESKQVVGGLCLSTDYKVGSR